MLLRNKRTQCQPKRGASCSLPLSAGGSCPGTAGSRGAPLPACTPSAQGFLGSGASGKAGLLPTAPGTAIGSPLFSPCGGNKAAPPPGSPTDHSCGQPARSRPEAARCVVLSCWGLSGNSSASSHRLPRIHQGVWRRSLRGVPSLGTQASCCSNPAHSDSNLGCC